MPATIEDARAQARNLIDTLAEEELWLLVAYAQQLRSGHFAALTRGLEHLLEESA